jgi:hypothetical protein
MNNMLSFDIEKEISLDVVGKLGDPNCCDGDTVELVNTIVMYVVNGWVTVCDGNISRLIELKNRERKRTITSICAMISMAHSMRSDHMEDWFEKTGRAKAKNNDDSIV